MMLRASAAVLFAALVAAQTQAPPPPPRTGSPLAEAAAAAAAARRTPVPTDPGLGQPIALTFAWPAGMVATIEAERAQTTVLGGQKKERGSGMRYRMRVTPHANGRLISYDGFEPLKTLLPSSGADALVETLSAFMPSLVVSPRGEFVRVEGLTRIRTAMRAFVDQALREASAPVTPQAKALLDSLWSAEVLTKMAAQEWQVLVGAFAGYRGTIGEMQEIDTKEESPLVPGVMIPMRSTFGALHRVPCEPGRPADSCVVMQLRSVIAPGAAQAVVKKLLEGVPDMRGLSYDRFDITTEVLTTLEPSTMKLYHVTQTRTADMLMRMAGQGTAAAMQTDRRTFRITYQ
jgi:hypothetical protein